MHVCCVRIRRTQSGGLPADAVDSNDFKRGGVRSTAGPRLAGVGYRDTGRYDWYADSRDIMTIKKIIISVYYPCRSRCGVSQRSSQNGIIHGNTKLFTNKSLYKKCVFFSLPESRTALLSLSGPVIRCVCGWRILGWGSTSLWPVSGWAVDRRCSQLPRMTSKRYTGKNPLK